MTLHKREFRAKIKSMEMVLVIIAFALLVAGLLGAVLPVLPGPPLSFVGLLMMHFSGYGGFTFVFLLVWALITVAVTIMDYVLPSYMARRFGGSHAAAIGSFLGLLAGLFFFPPWGLVFGSFLGALAGELVHNGANGVKAFKIALGAFLAFIVGSGAKLAVSAVMLFYAVRAMLG